MHSKFDMYGTEITIPLFGERLTLALEARKMSQAELARRCGYSSRRLMNDYVHDLKYPSIGHLFRMCQELNVSADYLLGFSEEM